jgi:hypothetical protein
MVIRTCSLDKLKMFPALVTDGLKLSCSPSDFLNEVLCPNDIFKILQQPAVMLIFCFGLHERDLLNFALNNIQTVSASFLFSMPSEVTWKFHTCRIRNRLFSRSTPLHFRSSVTSFAEDFFPFI